MQIILLERVESDSEKASVPLFWNNILCTKQSNLF